MAVGGDWVHLARPFLFQCPRPPSRLIYRPERLHFRFHRLDAPCSSPARDRAGACPMPQPPGPRASAKLIIAVTQLVQFRSRGSDEGNDSFRRRSRHDFLGQRCSDLWHKLARSSMSVSGTVLSPGMARLWPRPGGRCLHCLESGPEWSLGRSCPPSKARTIDRPNEFQIRGWPD
jgi:hypothetical protein